MREGKKRKNRLITAAMAGILTLILSLAALPMHLRAMENTDSYDIYILDYEDLLTDEEEDALYYEMEGLAAYGGAAFISDSSSDAEQTAADYCYRLFRNQSGTVFLIDMGDRRISIMSSGAMYKRITKNYATLITDNIYELAKNGDYLGCASEAFAEMETLMEGGRIAQPMRHITNLLMALAVGLMGNFLYVWVAKKRVVMPDPSAMAMAAGTAAAVGILSKNLVNSRKSRHSSRSRSGGSGGGGGGGGGFSGGGGSHRF